MSNTPKHSVSVAGIVVDDQDRVLVIQRRDNRRWEPPGGVLELDETPEQGARREVLEETGVNVEVQRLTGVYKNMRGGIVALVFRCRPTDGIARPTDESRNVRWLRLEDIVQTMAPAFAVRVTDAFETTPIVRVHDGEVVLQQ